MFENKCDTPERDALGKISERNQMVMLTLKIKKYLALCTYVCECLYVHVHACTRICITGIYMDDILQDESEGSASRLKELLQIPTLPVVQLQIRGEARVLTSSKLLNELEEKEKLKSEKEAQKQLQMLRREEKRQEQCISCLKQSTSKLCFQKV